MIRLSAFADEISQDPREQIDVLTRHGVKHIEFRAIHGTNVLDLSDEQHREFRSMLGDAGFGLSALGSPIGKIKITDPFEPHLDRYAKALDLADFYGCPRIRIFSFYMPAGDDPTIHRSAVMDRMSQLADIAVERNVALFLENEKGIYGDLADRVHDLLTTVDSPALSHAFDPANYVEVGQSIDPAWTLLKPFLTHFHVKDYSEAQHKNVPAGEGDGQIPALLADAVGGGYDGFVVLEPHLTVAELSYGFTGPERFADAANALKRILKEKSIPFA
ncbi:sugar phosphate isomerase/epimerase family protein [Paludisphaera rhizosphaerae]|uniref:sugar phosphate isomerase/epimerase family protein n=1 Tax=Paludisphaera rhizosphaerae TaxID=2711216 RepID=UPI0013EC1A97|nr:sugar phosphate isomerase/epimerase [Paludisphaera rhizosphaerae]